MGLGEPGGRLGPGHKRGLKKVILLLIITIISGEGGPDTKGSLRAARSLGMMLEGGEKGRVPFPSPPLVLTTWDFLLSFFADFEIPNLQKERISQIEIWVMDDIGGPDL